MPAKGQKKGQQVTIASERRREAFDLRKRGATYDEIGRVLGITKQAAYELVKRELDYIRANMQDDVEAVRAMELERLDRLFAGSYAQAAGGDPKALASIMRVMERRARLLGLDAPIRQDIELVAFNGSELDREVIRLATLATDGAGSQPGRVDPSAGTPGPDTDLGPVD